MTKMYTDDVVIRYIRSKNKTRKLATYRSEGCELRKTHEKICGFLTERFIPSIFSKAYVKHRSIYHNAYAHMYNDYFVLLDVKDFFPSICHKQLTDKLYYEINLREQDQISKQECRTIVEQCSISSRGLPLGFVTSPILSNVYMKEFDNIFYGKLKALGLDHLIYTRYADDMTISCRDMDGINPAEVKRAVIGLASVVLKRYGLRLNEKKTREFHINRSNHVRITGVVITKAPTGRRRLSVGRATKNQLFWDALKCLETKEPEQIAHIKGLQSFILSIEKNGYEDCYSPAMLRIIQDKGFESLKMLIDSL